MTRYLQARCSFLCVVSFCLLAFLPESPRYLLAKQKVSDAEQIVKKIAKMNQKKLLDDFNLNLPAVQESGQKYSYLDLLKSCKVLLTTLCIGVQWTTVGLLYYGLALESNSMGGDMYVTFALTACADLPSFFVSAYTCNR